MVTDYRYSFKLVHVYDSYIDESIIEIMENLLSCPLRRHELNDAGPTTCAKINLARVSRIALDSKIIDSNEQISKPHALRKRTKRGSRTRSRGETGISSFRSPPDNSHFDAHAPPPFTLSKRDPTFVPKVATNDRTIIYWRKEEGKFASIIFVSAQSSLTLKRDCYNDYEFLWRGFQSFRGKTVINPRSRSEEQRLSL